MYRISVNPQIHFGKPCIEGTRITVQSVLELLNEGLSFGTIIQDYYPDLQVEDIRACLQYAIARRQTLRLVSVVTAWEDSGNTAISRLALSFYNTQCENLTLFDS